MPNVFYHLPVSKPVITQICQQSNLQCFPLRAVNEDLIFKDQNRVQRNVAFTTDGPSSEIKSLQWPLIMLALMLLSQVCSQTVLIRNKGYNLLPSQATFKIAEERHNP